MTTVETLAELISQHQAALNAEAVVKDQIADLDKSVSQAERKIAEIKANDSADISGLARELSEHEAVIELAAGRRTRLQEHLQAAKNGVSTKRREIEMTTKPAMSAVLGYRRNLRIQSLLSHIAEWISPESLTGVHPSWLRETVLSLAAHDRNLDAVSILTAPVGGGYGEYNRAVWSGDIFAQAKMLIEFGPEVDRAERWSAEAQRTRTKAATEAPWKPFKEAEHIHIYAK